MEPKLRVTKTMLRDALALCVPPTQLADIAASRSEVPYGKRVESAPTAACELFSAGAVKFDIKTRSPGGVIWLGLISFEFTTPLDLTKI